MNPLALLKLVPMRFWVDLAIALCVVAALGCVWWAGARHGERKVQALWNAEAARQAKDALSLAERNAAETERRLAAQETIVHEANEQAARNAADAAGAVDAARRLRQRVAAIVAGAAASNPAAAAGCEAAGDPIGVLADVLERADERAGILAAYADAARTAGRACERAYDALSAPP